MSQFNGRLCALRDCLNEATQCSTLSENTCVPVCDEHWHIGGELKREVSQ